MLNHTYIDPRSGEESDEGAAEEPEQVRLAIKLNDESSKYECAVCGDERISAEGPGLFMADTWDSVCDECGRRYAPLLVALLDLGGAAEGYVTVRDATPRKDSQAG